MPYRSETEPEVCGFCNEPATEPPCRRCGAPMCSLHVYSDDGYCHRCSPVVESKRLRSRRARRRGLLVVSVTLALTTTVVVACYGYARTDQYRILRGKLFLLVIAELQEAYYDRHGHFCDASGGKNRVGRDYPGLLAGYEPVAKAWRPDRAPRGWRSLVAAPPLLNTEFTWLVEASDPGSDHARYGRAPPSDEPGPWFYVVGLADLDGKGPPYTELFMMAPGPPEIQTRNEGK